MDHTIYTKPCPSSSSNCRKPTNTKNNKNKKKGITLSTDPQSVAARARRHRISERFKILQSLIPGGSKLDIVSMLDRAIQYVQFLKAQIWLHQAIINNRVINYTSNSKDYLYGNYNNQSYYYLNDDNTLINYISNNDNFEQYYYCGLMCSNSVQEEDTSGYVDDGDGSFCNNNHALSKDIYGGC